MITRNKLRQSPINEQTPIIFHWAHVTLHLQAVPSSNPWLSLAHLAPKRCACNAKVRILFGSGAWQGASDNAPRTAQVVLGQ